MKKKIGVVGMGQGAGSTFVATSLAEELASQGRRIVGFAEIRAGAPGRALLYDSLAMNARFSGRNFAAIYTRLRGGKTIRGIANIEDNINWALLTPQENTRRVSLSLRQQVQLINQLSADIIICDIEAAQWNEALISQLDELIFVIDPMPSRIIANLPLYNRVKEQERRGKKIIWVVNKWSPGVREQNFFYLIRARRWVRMPLINETYFYDAEYNCQLPYQKMEIKKLAKKPIDEILKLHIIFT